MGGPSVTDGWIIEASVQSPTRAASRTTSCSGFQRLTQFSSGSRPDQHTSLIITAGSRSSVNFSAR